MKESTFQSIDKVIASKQMDDVLAPLFDFLGESPEAWRGALGLVDLLRGGLKTVVDSNATDDKGKEGVALIMALSTLVAFDVHSQSRFMRHQLFKKGGGHDPR